jgi:hypothetical protein
MLWRWKKIMKEVQQRELIAVSLKNKLNKKRRIVTWSCKLMSAATTLI